MTPQSNSEKSSMSQYSEAVTYLTPSRIGLRPDRLVALLVSWWCPRISHWNCLVQAGSHSALRRLSIALLLRRCGDPSGVGPRSRTRPAQHFAGIGKFVVTL